KVVLALALIIEAARLQDLDVVGIGFQRLAEARNRLIILSPGSLGVGTDGKRDREILGRRVCARDDLVAGLEPDLLVTLPLPADGHVIGELGLGGSGIRDQQ